ncbi:single-stranded DNA-binding protein [Methylobacterium fujisawaense]|uniref:single-stranded DNA-binding protein n=1 Tax=Methylobacterium fujisawaense TaxID=107400 RepID=UPI003CC7AB77
MLNKVTLIGRLGRDPEVRHTQAGDRVVSFGLATSERWKDKTTGERKERTEWHNVVIFNDGLGKVAEQYLKKGSKVYLEGQIQSRKYQGNDGVERTAYEIVLRRYAGEMTLLDEGERRPAPDPESYGTTRSRESAAASVQSGGAARPAVPAGSPARAGYDLDDDIPF